MRPGHGKLNVLAYGEKLGDALRAGGKLEYVQHVTKPLSLFATGWAGAERRDKWSLDAGAAAGVRFTW